MKFCDLSLILWEQDYVFMSFFEELKALHRTDQPLYNEQRVQQM